MRRSIVQACCKPRSLEIIIPENNSGLQKTILAPLLILILLSGCGGGGQHWYNHGKTRLDFDGDSQECEIVAGEFARQATLTGRREDPQTYARVFDDCLFARGWSVRPAAPPAPDSALAVMEPVFAVYHSDGTIEAFGGSFAVPVGFVLRADSTQRFGPTLIQNLLFMGPDLLFMDVTVQKSQDHKFEPTNYPVQEPFFLYEQGREGKQDRLRWAIFAGRIQEEWVVGLGGYLLRGERERLTVVITSPLPGPENAVPPGLNLSSGQFQAVERFRKEWLSWLQEQI
jgi:hypothetical protein